MIHVYWHVVQLDAAGRVLWRLFTSFKSLEYTDADRLVRHCIQSGRRQIGMVRAT